MVLPTERDQRDMSMRRHKLFFLFFFSEFFFGGFLKVSFVSTRHYQMCTTTSNECLNRLSEDFLSLYIPATVSAGFSFQNSYQKFKLKSKLCQFSFDYFYFVVFSRNKLKDNHSSIFGFCFILCLNFKIATSRISSCCAWIQIAQHFVVVGARELALGKRVGRRLVSRRSDVKRFLKKSKNKIKKSLLLLTCLLQWFCEVSLSRRCGSIWRHQLEPLPLRSSSTVFVCLFLFFLRVTLLRLCNVYLVDILYRMFETDVNFKRNWSK